MERNKAAIHSFLLIGQSNMVGRGFVREAMPVDMRRIKVLKDGIWCPMVRPANPDANLKGVSLAESFAERYAAEHNVDVGLICCAEGGTCIDQWCVGGMLFERACSLTEVAAETSIIKGILWHQGESDCEDEKYPVYEEKMTVVLDAFRERLGLENVPLIVGGLGDYLGSMNPLPRYQNYVYINEAIKSYAQKRALTEYVSSQGLLPNEDKLHFNAKSLHELGIRYYEAYIKCR